jgi:hypothetical protein
LALSSSEALKSVLKRVLLNVGGLLIGAVEATSHAVVKAFDVLMGAIMGRAMAFRIAHRGAEGEAPVAGLAMFVRRGQGSCWKVGKSA